MDQDQIKNVCSLPLLAYHIDDPRFLNTKVIKSMYSKMMNAEGLNRSFGVEGKMTKWWVGEKDTDEEKMEEKEFWKIQVGCNPPPGMSSKKINWPSTLKKYIIRCYLFHLGSMESVKEYYEYDHFDEDRNGEQVADVDVGDVGNDPAVVEERVGMVGQDQVPEAEEEGAIDEVVEGAKDNEESTEEVSFTPDYLTGVFSWGSLAALPEKKEPVVLQYRACMRDGGLEDKVVSIDSE